MADQEFDRLIQRAHGLLDRLEALLPEPTSAVDWDGTRAWRWRRDGTARWLDPVAQTDRIELDALRGIDRQREQLETNTRQFLAGLPANNALLWGSRGTGKSSLIKALLNCYGDDGLRLIEIDRHHLVDLPDVLTRIAERPERFVLFCDDLSFEEGDASYKSLKVALDGSLSSALDNVLVYATSNRRHLLPEYMDENRLARHVDGEVHQSEAVEEKIALSERFGLWLSFYPFDQDQYLAIVRNWLKRLGAVDVNSEEITGAALQWALARGSRSGRSAWQFARHWVGMQALRSQGELVR